MLGFRWRFPIEPAPVMYPQPQPPLSTRG
jgi:hypothetical protein